MTTNLEKYKGRKKRSTDFPNNIELAQAASRDFDQFLADNK